MLKSGPDVTGFLVAWSQGDEGARTRLVEAVYAELRRLARGYLQRERPDHSLPPTALVHEVYLKLVDQRRVQWQNRTQFFAIAAHLMRRILVDHARTHNAQKRGGGDRVPLEDRDAAFEPLTVDVVALDLALQRLAESYPRQSQLVELRFFGGLTVEEIATVLDVAPITVKRDWALAKAWLYRELHGEAAV
ncbi:MAG TPA: sigma-70 family RNA polymerase sigma factor [Vicinamibacterales bacterium]|nr:sigma-70 family RNA polymerase sigma factor [Vicinamibacterales bacterium]